MAFPPPPGILSARNLSGPELAASPAETLLRIYAWMHLARITDNRILDLFRQGLMRGTVTGGQGNEALIVPLALLANKALDTVSFTHRDLGGHLIWGTHLCTHLNQYFANAGSPTKAREGKTRDGNFAISSTLTERGLTYAHKKPVAPFGLKPKDLVGIPWRVAFALQADGWYLRSDIIWAKPNPN